MLQLIQNVHNWPWWTESKWVDTTGLFAITPMGSKGNEREKIYRAQAIYAKQKLVGPETKV